MILIADSGSTKTEWVLGTSPASVISINTQGINPYFQSEETILGILVDELIPSLPPESAEQVQTVQYYGAGCSTDATKATVRQALQHVFPQAYIEVEHDLLAAARAACGNQPGIAAILGTGSNSCLFDGTNITANQPSLGFILGDEGSGGWIGKELLRRFIYHELPEHLSKQLEQQYTLTKENILEQVYQKPMPNRYAASFTRFAGEHRTEAAIQEILFAAFDAFFKHHISSYPDFRSYPLNAVGSVAAVFADELRAVAAQYGVEHVTIIQKPMDGLIRFHLPTV